jgi:outer membrane protein TolC
MNKQISLSVILVFGVLFCRAQDSDIKVTLSLKNVLDLAVKQSSSVKYTQNNNVNYYWRWKNFQTTFRPQLTLSGDLPNYVRAPAAVTQPDGSVAYKQISQLNTSTTLALSQAIPLTGTYIYVASSLYRNHDYYKDTTNFSGNPFYIGFTQPLFAYNWMKWAKKTEPLIYDEAQKAFVQSIEEISHEATARFFRYLQIQTSYSLAESNLKNSQDNLKIAEVKQKIGDISENDFSRITLSVLNAQKALDRARMDLKNADFELKTYIGLDQNMNINLQIPLDMVLFNVDVKIALDQAKSNRKETPYFERRLIEADRDLAAAKHSNGYSMTLSGSFGLSKSSPEFTGVYQSPDDSRSVRLTMSVPIMDWGRSASKVKLAESQRDLTLFDVEKNKTTFERQIVVEVEQFNLLKDQLVTAKEADKVAENGYKIALKKFQNGEISITDLNISLSERETAKKDYIASIANYWESYYMVRILTLYDFETDAKISYANPMLAGN